MQKPPLLVPQQTISSQQVQHQHQSAHHQHHQGVVGVVATNNVLNNNNNNNMNMMNNNNSDSYGGASSSMSATSSSSSLQQQQQQTSTSTNSIVSNNINNNNSTKSNKKESKTKRKSKSLPNSSYDQLSSSDDKKKRTVEATVSPSVSSGDSEDLQAKNKKQRLSWTNELHQSFVEAVSVLGLDNAAPKAIKNLMGVSRVTTDHIKSHLQKYRLQIKKGDELLPPPKETPEIKETKEVTEPTPQETTQKTGKKKKKSTTSNIETSPVKEETPETVSVKNVEVISENLNNNNLNNLNEVKHHTQQSNSNSMEQSCSSRSNSIGFNNWNFHSNAHSNSIPSIYELHNSHVEKEHESSLLDHGMNNDASNSNFSFLKKSFLDNTNSGGSFLFDNSQSGFLVLPSLSNLGGDEPTSNHLPVFAEKEERTQNLPSSFGFNVNSKSSFLSESTSHPTTTNLTNNPPPPPPPQNQNEQCISFTNSSLQHYSSMLAEMCRTDDEIRQLFIDAKNNIKADEHFLLLLLGYRLGVMSEKRSKK